MPRIYVNTIEQGSPSIEYKTLMIGSAEHTQTGVSTGSLVTTIASKSALITAIGGGTFLYNMADAFWKADKKFQTTLDFIFLEETVAATAGTRTIPLTGTATAAGSFTVAVGDRAWTATVAVAIDDTAEEIGVALDAALDELENFPFTPSNSTGTLTLTSKVYGGIESAIPLKISGSAEGIVIGTLGGVAGVNPPVVTGIQAILDAAEARYDVILVEDGVVMTPITTMLETYKEINNLDQQGNVILSSTDTYASLLVDPATYNDRTVWLSGLKAVTSATETSSNHIFTTECLWRSYVAGIYAVCLTEGADCSDFLPNIALGSPDNRSVPFADIVSEDYYVTDGEGWTLTEMINLEAAGVFVVHNNTAGNLELGNVVTTYVTDSEGNPDVAFHFVNGQLIAQFSNSYFYTMLKTLKHQRLYSATARSKITSYFSLWYDALSNVQEDENGNKYILLDSDGKDEFMTTLKDTMTVTLSSGEVDITKAVLSILSQLRIVQFFNKFQYL